MNPENSKKSDPHKLLLNLSEEIDLKKSYKLNRLLYRILACTKHGKI